MRTESVSYSFQAGNAGSVTLTDDAGGIVVADAIKLVRDITGETDTEAKDVTYSYDVNGNQVQVQDNSSDATVDTYTLTNDGLNRVAQVQESLAGIGSPSSPGLRPAERRRSRSTSTTPTTMSSRRPSMG